MAKSKHITGTKAEAYLSKRAWARPKLKAFLDEKKLYKQYTKNCKHYSTHNLRWNKTLDESFTFSNTPEGFRFWWNLNTEFDNA